jgi:uncharacterized protein YdaU (DUF1376 family)
VNYWPRWINAITRKTAHLSLAAMGAYDRLLDHYYAHEAPLPGSFDECCRIVRAMTKTEREAVKQVLSEFFALDDGKFVQDRADEEIALAKPKMDAARTNGKRGGRPKGSKNKPAGFPPGIPTGTHEEPSPKAPQPQPHIKQETEDLPCSAGAGVRDPGLDGFEPTAHAVVCRAIRQAGIAAANPSNPRLRSLVDAGATSAEFLAFVAKSLEARDPFAYLLGAVEGERKRAAKTSGALHRGPMPSANRQEAIEARNRAVADEWLAQQGETQ